jgi:hypothetical protein
MKPVNVIDRLEYLAESFDIFEKICTLRTMAKFKALESEGYLPSFVKNITTFDSEVIAIVSNKTTTPTVRHQLKLVYRQKYLLT